MLAQVPIPKSLYETIWNEGLQPDLIDFFFGLNWFYIIMLTVILYGVKHTNLFDWFGYVLKKIKTPKKYSYWILAIITAIVFCVFRYLEGNVIDAFYISGMLRSVIFTVVFSNIFVDIPVYMIKGFGKYIDTKTK